MPALGSLVFTAINSQNSVRSSQVFRGLHKRIILTSTRSFSFSGDSQTQSQFSPDRNVTLLLRAGKLLGRHCKFKVF